MPYHHVCISSGHGLKVRGASSDMCDEVDEARIVTEALATELRARGVEVKTYHDDVSVSQSENLSRITDWHNGQSPCDVAISVHFNAFEQVDHGMGVEVLYYSQQALAADLSAAIAGAAGLIDRGAKKRTDLFVLANTVAPCVLLETAFVDSVTDVELYRANFDAIIDALAFELSGVEGDDRPGLPQRPDRPPRPPPEDVLFHVVGKCSYFGGPDDFGVAENEGLAFHYEINERNEQLFLPINTGTGLARQLNCYVPYLAVRWNYSDTPKEMLANSGQRALVRSTATGREVLCWPADWGPAGPESDHDTGRVCDLSPGAMEILGIETDDEVEVIYPYRE